MYTYVCYYVCLNVCRHVRMHLCMCVCIGMYVCMRVRMYFVRMLLCIHFRTIFYRARKERNVGVFLDLTKFRLDKLNKARDLVKNVSSVKFVYSDINCALRVLTESGKHVAFKSLDDLKKIISDL